ncbi:MAG: proliferating cell nuclear antigen (pcna) [Candidatus Hodarchaeales archaeon]
MFKATMKDTGFLKDSLSAISDLIDEAVFQIKKDGIDMVATDRAVVAVVNFRLLPTAFTSYKCDKDVSAGLNLINFMQILKRAKPDDSLTLRFDPDAETFEVILEGESTRKFTLPIIDVSEQDLPDVNKLKFTAEVELSPVFLKDSIDDADLVSDSAFIEVSKDGLAIRAEGDSSTVHSKLEKSSPALKKLKATSLVTSRYSIEYLKKMLKAEKLADKVSASLGQDFPLKMDFDVKDKMSLSFILAPRVEET